MVDQVHNHPLNDSPSKQQFSFSKAKRFHAPLKPKQAFSFGSAARKFGMCIESDSYTEKNPPPGAYNPSDIEEKRPGWSFGNSKKAEIPGTSLSTKYLLQIPGPGAYNVIPVDFGQNSMKFSMRPRTRDQFTHRSQTPGPGTYKPKIEISPTGVYFASNIPSSCAPRIAPQSDIRTKILKKSEVPGPGSYSPKTEITKDGNYFLSQIPSTKCRTFGKETRSSSVHRIQTPGPGSYRVPSDFGFYDSPITPSYRHRSVTPSERKHMSAREFQPN